MGFFRRSPQPEPTADEPVETGPSEAELAAARDRIIEHVAGRSEEELRLELPNYDPERLGELTRTVARHAEDPELAARVVTAAGFRSQSLRYAGERDTDWVVRFANALPDDEERPGEAATLIKAKVDEMEPTVASIPAVENLIDAMPVDPDDFREEYVATVATWQAVSSDRLLEFTAEISDELKRDAARSVATRVFTSKNPEATVADAKALVGGITSTPSAADEAWVSAAKHFATHGEIEPAELQQFIAEARTEDVVIAAVRKVAIRYFFNNGRDKLIELIDCFPPAKQPEFRAMVAEAIYESKENEKENYGYRHTTKRYWDHQIVAALTPKTELVGLIDAATTDR